MREVRIHGVAKENAEVIEMTAVNIIALLILSITAFSSPVHAQDLGPEQVAHAYYQAFEKGNWSQIVELSHPHVLQEIKDALIDALPWDSIFIIHNPGSLLKQQLDIEDGSDIRTISADVVMKAFLSALPAASQSVFKGVERDTRSFYIGQLSEGDSLIHVLRRATFAPDGKVLKPDDELYSTRINVLTLKRDDGSWRVFNNDYLDMQEIIRMMF